ncbi:hypothetical protein Cni_G01366 [Canna indica]|uniref:FAS1 domain-containing protein n=1 Tax=Canna indica TaxID=4628 RepID=A0AAQ3JQ93_9LILI|nr:hypothetical protein Cni_G01366 [Canna indica]
MAALRTLTLFALLSLLFPFATSINITLILSNFTDFSTFSNLLTQAQLVSDINNRQTITVLAVNNDAASSVSGRPVTELKKILSVHVILDYYDGDKIHKLSNGTAIVTTLFQASGLAADQNGFLNVTDMDNGQVAFGSAAKGAPLSANFVKEVATRPFNISVLQVSSVIIPPGVSGGPSSNNTTAPTAAPSNSSASPATTPPSHAPSRGAVSPPGAADAPASHSPPASPPAPPGPDDSPAGAPSGASDSPAGTPSGAADAPSADGSGKSSAADWAVVATGVAVVVGFAMLASL